MGRILDEQGIGAGINGHAAAIGKQSVLFRLNFGDGHVTEHRALHVGFYCPHRLQQTSDVLGLGVVHLDKFGYQRLQFADLPGCL